MYQAPKHIVAVSGYVKNEQDEVLLVKTHYRSDTWELPGGQVEEGEPLEDALMREFKEETGIDIIPIGISGTYYNTTSHVLNIMFIAKFVQGELVIQPEEIKEAKFVKLTEANIDEYITRPHMKSRTLDAMNCHHVTPCESWEVRPFRLIGRVGGE